jgi:hypothetical protein
MAIGGQGNTVHNSVALEGDRVASRDSKSSQKEKGSPFGDGPGVIVGNAILEASLPGLEKREGFDIGRGVGDAGCMGKSLAMAKREEDGECCDNGHVGVLGVIRKREIEAGH